jgi:magnesium-transporting ATPase (P-type)
VTSSLPKGPAWSGTGVPDLPEAAGLPVEEVLARLSAVRTGLTSSEASRRLALVGPNALRGHVAGPAGVLGRQLMNPFLLLLAATAVISILLRDQTDAAIILGIIILSVGLGFVNEYRAERAIADLHARVRHTARVLRDGGLTSVDVRVLVPGDIVILDVGDVIPADLRLLDAQALACEEAILTGESMPADKTVAADTAEGGLSLSSCVHRERDRPSFTVRIPPVRAGNRRKPDSTIAAGNRHGQPRHRGPPHGPTLGAREASRQHRGSRQYHGALYRQDGDPDRAKNPVRRSAATWGSW